MGGDISYKFQFYHALTLQPLGSLEIADPIWNDPVRGIGEFSGHVFLLPSQDKDRIQTRIHEDYSLLVIFENDSPVWVGWTQGHTWLPKSQRFSLKYVQLRGWLYKLFLKMNWSLSTDTMVILERFYKYVQQDQTAIARDLVNLICRNNDPGLIPVEPWNVPSAQYLTGVLRDLSIPASSFVYLGEAIDSMALRDEGFDWDVAPSIDPETGALRLFFKTWFPERSTGNKSLFFENNNKSGKGNIIDYPDEFPFDVSDRATRTWATGAGQPPDQKVAMDYDPVIDDQGVILTEVMTNHSTVMKPATLHGHARAQRIFSSVKHEEITISVDPYNPPITSYTVGDRCRLKFLDEVVGMDQRGLRIIDRAIAPESGDNPLSCAVTIDLSDLTVPEDEQEVPV